MGQDANSSGRCVHFDGMEGVVYPRLLFVGIDQPSRIARLAVPVSSHLGLELLTIWIAAHCCTLGKQSLLSSFIDPATDKTPTALEIPRRFTPAEYRKGPAKMFGHRTPSDILNRWVLLSPSFVCFLGWSFAAVWRPFSTVAHRSNKAGRCDFGGLLHAQGVNSYRRAFTALLPISGTNNRPSLVGFDRHKPAVIYKAGYGRRPSKFIGPQSARR